MQLIRRFATKAHFAVMLLLAALLLSTLPAAAQIPIDPLPPVAPGFPIVPPQPWPPAPVPPVQFPVTVTLHQVDAVVDGPVASVTVKQVFRNDTAREIEGTYIFPLPPDAAPYGSKEARS